MQNSCRRRWPGLFRAFKARWCTFARMLVYSCVVCICNVCFLCVLFFFCVVTSFFRFVFTKLVMHFFWIVSFCILLPVWIYVVHNQFCIDLLAGLIFVFACAFAYLPYFFVAFFFVLHYFFHHIGLIYMCCLFAGFICWHFLVLDNFRSLFIRFFCAADRYSYILLFNLLCFAFLLTLLCCCCLVSW